MSDLTVLERVLRRDRTVVAAALVALFILSWAYLLTGAGAGMRPWEMTTLSLFPHKAALAPMVAEAMPGMDMPGMSTRGAAPEPAGFWLTVAMWWTMMVAMMSPSAAPAVLLYARVARHSASAQPAASSIGPNGAFLAGYLAVWLTFSLAAAFLQGALQSRGLLSPAILGSQSRWLSAAVLAAAGVYQLSPAKQLCLTQCRTPAAFFTRHWRPGVVGAVRLGALHGAYCVGCCWVLMALLFVGGVMNMAWVAALTLLVMAEKLLPRGAWVARASGLALIAWAGATLLV